MDKKNIAHAGSSILEKVVGELALPVSLLSATQEGNAFERAVGGITTTARAAYNGIESYVFNSGVRDTINGAGVEVLDMLGNFGTNMVDHPVETLYTVLGTYTAFKVAPYISRKMRHRYRERPIEG